MATGLLEALGVILCPYHRYYYKTKEILAEELVAFQSGTTRAEVVKVLEGELLNSTKPKSRK